MSTPQPPVGTPWHEATFPTAWGRFWRGSVTFRGRAARSEFWWWALWWLLLSSVVQIPWVIGLATWRPEQPSVQQTQTLDQAMTSFDPFPVWGYLLSSLPPVAAFGLVLFAGLVLAALLPWVALAVRRLHDTNRSGWWVLLYVVPFGSIVLLVFTTLPSDERGARFDRG